MSKLEIPPAPNPLIKPVLQDDAFLADVDSVRAQKKQFHLWWLGQSGFLLQFQERFALIDPYLSDSLTAKYAETETPHIRMTERVIAPERLGFAEVISSSHNHTDHFDPDTIKAVWAANPKLQVLLPEANRGVGAFRIQKSPKELIGAEAGLTKSIANFRFHGIPAAHNELEKDQWDRHKFLGYVIEFGPYRIYHSGDTLVYDGIADWVRPFKVDVAILPINGNKPERKVAGNLDGLEAARLAKAINARIVIPCHYEMFTFNTASPDEFVAECGKIGQECKVMKAGERWTSPW
ncbi:MAG: MBL fold metallo-hydrolase [Verrucomicrobiota bacterium]